MNFSSIFGSIPRVARAVQEVAAAGVSAKKKFRKTLSTSNQLKLSKSVREGVSDKLAFSETTGLIGNGFKTVYDQHMRVEALSKALLFYDLIDILQIIHASTVNELTVHLDDLNACQKSVDMCDSDILSDLRNLAFKNAKTAATTLYSQATS